MENPELLPVGWILADPKSESENVDPVVVDVGVDADVPDPKALNDVVVSCGNGGLPELLPERKEDATLVKVVAGAPVC